MNDLIELVCILMWNLLIFQINFQCCDKMMKESGLIITALIFQIIKIRLFNFCVFIFRSFYTFNKCVKETCTSHCVFFLFDFFSSFSVSCTRYFSISWQMLVMMYVIEISCKSQFHFSLTWQKIYCELCRLLRMNICWKYDSRSTSTQCFSWWSVWIDCSILD